MFSEMTELPTFGNWSVSHGIREDRADGSSGGTEECMAVMDWASDHPNHGFMESQNSMGLWDHGLIESYTHLGWKSPLRPPEMLVVSLDFWSKLKDFPLNFGWNVPKGKNTKNQLKSVVIKMCVVVSLFLWNSEFLDVAPCVPVRGILWASDCLGFVLEFVGWIKHNFPRQPMNIQQRGFPPSLDKFNIPEKNSM